MALLLTSSGQGRLVWPTWGHAPPSTCPCHLEGPRPQPQAGQVQVGDELRQGAQGHPAGQGSTSHLHRHLATTRATSRATSRITTGATLLLKISRNYDRATSSPWRNLYSSQPPPPSKHTRAPLIHHHRGGDHLRPCTPSRSTVTAILQT